MKLNKTSKGNYWGIKGNTNISVVKMPHNGYNCMIIVNGKIKFSEGLFSCSLPTIKKVREYIKLNILKAKL